MGNVCEKSARASVRPPRLMYSLELFDVLTDTHKAVYTSKHASSKTLQIKCICNEVVQCVCNEVIVQELQNSSYGMPAKHKTFDPSQEQIGLVLSLDKSN